MEMPLDLTKASGRDRFRGLRQHSRRQPSSKIECDTCMARLSYTDLGKIPMMR